MANFPQSVLLLSAQPKDYALALDTLEARQVAVRSMEGPFRLAADFAASPAEVVLLDIEWFTQAVLELIEVLRDRSPNVGIVVIALPSQRDLAGSALCRGADVVLTKPPSCAEVMAAIERAGRRRRLAEAGETGLSAELLTKFAMGVAHEINNPLATVSGWLQMLIGDREQDEQLVGTLKSMKEETDRIAAVVQQLLTVAQRTPPRMDTVSMAGLLNELARSASVTFKNRNAEFQSEIPEDLPSVRGDPTQLREACEAVLRESKSALGEGGRVEMMSRAQGDGIEVEFHDNGAPIPPDRLGHVFDPFEFTRNDNGTGVGLCLARAIVLSHGGSMNVTSDREEGTRFTIWLPAWKQS